MRGTYRFLRGLQEEGVAGVQELQNGSILGLAFWLEQPPPLDRGPASDSRLVVLSRHLGSQLAVETQQKAEEEEQWEAVERGVGSMTVTGDQENHRDSVATGTDFMKL